MEQIEQLKAMRDAAKARIEATPDFKLMHSLTALIDDLEEALGLSTPDGETSETGEDETAAEPQPSSGTDAGDPDGLRMAVASGGSEQAEEAYAAEANGAADPDETVETSAETELVEAVDSAIEALADETAEATAANSQGEFESETAQVAAELESALREAADAGDEAGDADDAASASEADELMEQLAAAAASAGSTDENEADAISRAMEELDADLASTKFNV